MYFLVTVKGSCNLPNIIVAILHEAYNIIRYLIPVGIVLFGTIDFLKAIMGKDEKDINSKIFIKRLLYGLLAFFVFSLVKWVFTILGNAGVGDASNAFKCASDILGGNNGTIIQPDNYENDTECCNQNYAICISNNRNGTDKEQDCIKEAQNKCKSSCKAITTTTTTTTTTVNSTTIKSTTKKLNDIEIRKEYNNQLKKQNEYIANNCKNWTNNPRPQEAYTACGGNANDAQAYDDKNCLLKCAADGQSLSEVDAYKFCIYSAQLRDSTVNEYINNNVLSKNEFREKCLKSQNYINFLQNIRRISGNNDPIGDGGCDKIYDIFKNSYENYIESHCKKSYTSLVEWYFNNNSNEKSELFGYKN